MSLRNLKVLLVVLAGLSWSLPALAQRAGAPGGDPHTWWLSLGLGGAAVGSRTPAPSAGRGAVAASLDFGFRITPKWGLGLELGAVSPVDGCSNWDCAGTSAQFAPDFTRIHVFSEYRLRESGWRFRAGLGVSRFCYRSHWSDSAWTWGDTLNTALILLDGNPPEGTISGSGGYRCDARQNALGGVVSVGYDWPVTTQAPVSMGLRLSAEAAGFQDTPAIGLPAFRHRAVMLTLHLKVN